MPELPEVETIKLGLNELIIGLSIQDIIIKNHKSFLIDENIKELFLINHKILNIGRRAKLLMINLDSDYSLVFHLKMTGQLVYVDHHHRFGAGHPNNSLINKLPDKSTRVVFIFNNNAQLFFNDQRKFGWIKAIPTSLLTDRDFFKYHGPEPLDLMFSSEVLYKRLLSHPKTKIKAALLNQQILSGLGNIYVDESLWMSKINPLTTVNQLTKKNIITLYKSIQNILNKSIYLGGSTDRNYVDAQGNKGNYLKFANVFRKENQPCPRCSTLIVKQKIVGRGTHFCPNCQKIKVEK